jgi:hypothetical protein
MSAALSGPALPSIVGFAEAITTDRILGWAWSPAAPGQRAKIELRLGDDVVAWSVADLPRGDLAGNGVGDGQHAYEITIPEAYRARSAELRVFARAGDTDPVQIGAPPAAEAMSEQVEKLLRGVDMLLGSQRLMHRNLQAALATKPNAANDGKDITESVARLADIQASLAEQLGAVERFVLRLDEHLARIASGSPDSANSARRVPRAAILALAVSGAAFLASIVGLIQSLAF